MKKRLLISVLCLVQFFVSAETFVLQQNESTYSLDASIEVLWDSLHTYSIADFANPDFDIAFQQASDIDFALVSGQYYWGKVSIENQLSASAQQYEWVLRFSNTWTELDVYIQQVDGSYLQQRNGTFVPQRKKEFFATSEGNLIKLLLAPNQPVQIYFRGKSARESIPPRFSLTLQHADDFYADLQFRKTSTVIFIGFVLMMLIYNLILYFFGGDRSYIYYSVYLLALVIYASFISEDLADWLEPYLFPEHPEYLYFGKLVIYMGLVSYLLFMRTFLDLGQLLSKWDRYFKWLCWLALPLLVLDVFLIFKSNFSYAVADLVTVAYIILFVLSVFAFIYPLYRTRDKKGYFIVAGIVFMGLGFLMTAFARGASPAFSLIYFKVGTLLEIIAFSLGLAYRQREIEQARQAASFELEKSKLLQQQEQAEAERLKELDQFKSRFYTSITHEFRTPLTVILGMNENIKGHEQEKKLIRRNSQNLLQLINQLLDLSKIESGNLKIDLIQGNIITYLQYLTESFYSMATEKNVRLTFYSEEDVLLIDYDEVKVQHIIYNLLSNAIKFTPEMGKVILHALRIEEDDQSYLKIKVKDKETRITEEQLPLIFDRFYQTNDTTPSDQNIGSGVGLALTKELIELMGGRIEVTSVLEKGSAFTVTLPITQNAQELDGALPLTLGEKLGSAATPSGVPVNNQKETSENHQGLNLLLIEDNPDVVTYIKSILSTEYNITVAINGQNGIDQAIETIPDIIISDVMMPEKDGYEVCATLKQDIRTSHIPIILLTAKATADDRVQGLQYGADAYLTKPFNKSELFVRLEKLTELRKQLQVYYSQGVREEMGPSVNNTLEKAFIEQLQETIHKNISDHQFGVPELAAEMAMSQSQLYRKFKAITGETPSSLIRSTRLTEGLRLLKTTDLNISEIAYDVGFSDPNYFSRAFNDAFGTSPRDTRSK